MASEDHSLTNRILHAVAKPGENLPEFPDDDAGSLPSDYDYDFDGDMEEVEEVEEITESDLLRFLDSQRDPLVIAQGLFKLDPNLMDVPAGLACLKREHVVELFNRGWTMLDGVVGEEIVNSK
ncbi:hypothetical protein BC937DRAFT_87862 [Endogone sp. FLAS-F59071]|nr:hypothetical protein BC937DRAFT_87862 [Endogone sp. FLAS-F59071]|eukprot:RUS19195.1 hypothetical protein BC937DRAFT_87862 [Endogone sp. FLAS-F59071]